MKHKQKINTKDKAANRRNFLQRLSSILGILAGVEFFGIGLAFLNTKPGNLQIKKKVQFFEAGKTQDFIPGSVTAFAGARFFLVRLKDGGFIALSLRCSHLGCAVSWHEKEQRFICPCHASQFDPTGNVISPPAPRALDYYPLEIQGNVVRVNTGKVVKRNTFEKHQVVYA